MIVEVDKRKGDEMKCACIYILNEKKVFFYVVR